MEGTALFTCNDSVLELRPGHAVDIGRGDRHRIENIGAKNLVFIEIQTGDYFGEDDIIRYEDDFGRVRA